MYVLLAQNIFLFEHRYKSYFGIVSKILTDI